MNVSLSKRLLLVLQLLLIVNRQTHLNRESKHSSKTMLLFN